MKLLEKISEMYDVCSDWVGENSPAILTGVGIVGLGATAYLTYKSASRVEGVVEYVEKQREDNLPIDTKYVGTELTGALALPVATGVLAIFCIVSSYQILNGRNAVLSSAFSALSLEYNRYRQKYVDEHGKEEADKFFALQEREVTNDAGEIVVEATPENKRSLTGVWFSESSEFVSDDIQYNIAYVEAVIKKLEVQIYNKGWVELNDVYSAFGLPEDRDGALLGFRHDDFSIDYDSYLNLTESISGKTKPDIHIRWNVPQYLWGKRTALSE